jgi:nucleoside-diphosphate-sugar epimerase
VRTAFVTGGTGFVGINLVEALRLQGWRVIAIHRETSSTQRLARLGAELRKVGLDDPAALAEAMPDGVDAVFHVAGDLSWCRLNNERQQRVNVDGTRNVVQAALSRRARRLVYTSSVASYGLGHTMLREDTVSTAPATSIGYIRTKWLGEQEVRKGIDQGLPAVILNPGPIMGPYNTTSWADLCRLLKRGKLPGVPPGAASHCHVREVVRAHIEAATRAPSGAQYLLGGTDVTYADVTDLLADMFGVKRPPVVPAWMLKTAGRVNDWIGALTRKEAQVTWDGAEMICTRCWADCSRSERELGVQTVSLREMAEDTVNWLVAENVI